MSKNKKRKEKGKNETHIKMKVVLLDVSPTQTAAVSPDDTKCGEPSPSDVLGLFIEQGKVCVFVCARASHIVTLVTVILNCLLSPI